MLTALFYTYDILTFQITFWKEISIHYFDKIPKNITVFYVKIKYLSDSCLCILEIKTSTVMLSSLLN